MVCYVLRKCRFSNNVPKPTNMKEAWRLGHWGLDLGCFDNMSNYPFLDPQPTTSFPRILPNTPKCPTVNLLSYHRVDMAVVGARVAVNLIEDFYQTILPDLCLITGKFNFRWYDTL